MPKQRGGVEGENFWSQASGKRYNGAMAILRTVLWSLAKRAAADPRVRKKAGQAIRTVDQKMDKAADKVANVAVAKDPAREAGKMLGAFFSGERRPKR